MNFLYLSLVQGIGSCLVQPFSISRFIQFLTKAIEFTQVEAKTKRSILDIDRIFGEVRNAEITMYLM